jgi:hypothetical protein
MDHHGEDGAKMYHHCEGGARMDLHDGCVA